MSEREELIRHEAAGLESLTEYHRRLRAEADLAALEKTQELEAERFERACAVAEVVARSVVDHPVATAASIGGLWLLGQALRSWRGR